MTTTPVQPDTRRLLPVSTPAHPGGRSAMTCHYRCADACAQPVPNESANTYFGDIVGRALSRRSVLRAGGAAALVGTTFAASVSPAAAGSTSGSGAGRAGRLDFSPIGPVPADTDALQVPRGFDWYPVIRWGDPVLAGAPAFDPDRQTPQAQAGQFGYNNDFTALLEDGGGLSGVLVCNHEYTNEDLMFRGWTSHATATADQLRTAIAAHGMSVVEVHRDGKSGRRNRWRAEVGGARNRRITPDTPMRFTGPAAGSPLLRTSSDRAGTRPVGTFNNCAGGVTPWGTVLTGEENFNGYFKGSTPADARVAAGYKRYGVTTSSGRGWERVDPRFDTAQEPHEPHRHGWVVEVDPSDPTSTPRKHTALGRFKHEGANVTVARDGRVVAYMGDDERFDYTYRFVSSRRMRRGSSAADRAHNLTLLEDGDLYVARFTGDGLEDGVSDGTGEWLPLLVDGESQVPGFTADEVLVWTRLAADAVQPTKMDRPEDVDVNPHNGRVYVLCTNNSNRTAAQVDEANPRPTNKHGHIVEISPSGGDHTARTFTWNLVLVAGDPADPSTYFAGYDKTKVSPISCPDNIAFGPDGAAWVATDGNALGHCDGLYRMPVAGTERGHLEQFLSVPVGAECCGPVVAADGTYVLVAVQHPGEVDGASASNPKSLFPYEGDALPRPSVVAVRRR